MAEFMIAGALIAISFSLYRIAEAIDNTGEGIRQVTYAINRLSESTKAFKKRYRLNDNMEWEEEDD